MCFSLNIQCLQITDENNIESAYISQSADTKGYGTQIPLPAASKTWTGLQRPRPQGTQDGGSLSSRFHHLSGTYAHTWG